MGQVAVQILGGDILKRFEFIIDEGAEPVDLDDALAAFLLAFIRHEPVTSTEASTADEVIREEADQRQDERK